MKNVLHVKVTNNNPELYEDRFDGILYRFAPDKTVTIPYEAATHIFGVDFAPGPSGHLDPQLRDKAYNHLKKRWGWNRPAIGQEYEKLEKRTRTKFDKIEFSVVHMQMVEAPVEELPRPNEAA